MEKEQLSRKLAVILHADVAGSTSLVQLNETLAHQRIQSVFNNFSGTIEIYGGVTREIRGDALLAEFNRSSDAVTAALAFQSLNEDVNSKFDDAIRPQLRIGVGMGEVVVADNTITGPGVVLAQRLEQLANPGGVIIQGSVAETVPARIPFEYRYIGEQTLKGFDQKVRAFVASLREGAELPPAESEPPVKEVELERPRIPIAPSIAILPFTNMSSDPEQEFFGYGIMDDIITALSKVSGLTVIARSSTSSYQGRTVDARQVGHDLGVGHVLIGSVRKVGSRVRINAQLIDAVTGQHRWADRYDRELQDIFAVQDEITRSVVSELDVHLRVGEQARLWSSGTNNLEAWECVRIGNNLLAGYRSEDVPEALRLARKSVELDPEFSEAWVFLSACHFHTEAHVQSVEERERALESAHDYAQRALECDPLNAHALGIVAMHDLHLRKHDEAVRNTKKSIELAPNHAVISAMAAAILNKCGQPERGLERIRKAMRLAPVYPVWFLSILGQSTRLMGMTDAAINACKELVSRNSDSFEGHVGLAEILGEAGRSNEAKLAASEVLRIRPNFTIREYVGDLAYLDSAENMRIAEGLRKAGLPE
jgi:adenylate cyclase